MYASKKIKNTLPASVSNKFSHLTDIDLILNKISIINLKNSSMLDQFGSDCTLVDSPSADPVEKPANRLVTLPTVDQTRDSKKLIQKASIGIACISYINEVPHILMVCKRYTYGFIDFILGKYQHGDIKNNKYIKLTLMRLFNKMTNDEKLDILSLNFSQMWYRIWLHETKINSQYYVYKNKFESMFCVDKGKKLKKLIEKSTSIHKIWEIPKGRKKNNTESDLNCAIREFSEETNISKRQYRIIPNIKKIYSYTSDNNTTYTNTYYLALTKQEIVPVINFNTQEQINEICDIRWMDLTAVRLIDNNCRLEPFIRDIFKTIKNKNLL